MSTIGLQHVPTTYRGYALDEFQIEAIRSLTNGESVLVSAPTGTGKTLIADYLIDITFRSGRQVVYTALPPAPSSAPVRRDHVHP